MKYPRPIHLRMTIDDRRTACRRTLTRTMWRWPKQVGGDTSQVTCPKCLAALHAARADLGVVLREMRDRKVNHGRGTSPTLLAWAKRLELAADCLGVKP